MPLTGNKTISLLIELALVLGLAVATALSAEVKIGIGIIPITLQTLVVLLSGILFGSRTGAAAQAAYLLGGLAGIPWFAAGGGLAYLLSPTFGYIAGFVVAAYITGLLAENGWAKNSISAAGAMAAGNAVIYIFGALWLAKYMPLSGALAIGVYPFLAGDALKIGAAASAMALVRSISRFGRV